jgi:hypothetical protein
MVVAAAAAEDTALEAALAPLVTTLEAALAPLLATLEAALAPLLATLEAALAPLLTALLAALPTLLAALPAALAADEPMLEALDMTSLVASLVAEQLTANAAAMARPPIPAAARAILVFILGVLLLWMTVKRTSPVKVANELYARARPEPGREHVFRRHIRKDRCRCGRWDPPKFDGRYDG